MLINPQDLPLRSSSHRLYHKQDLTRKRAQYLQFHRSLKRLSDGSQIVSCALFMRLSELIIMVVRRLSHLLKIWISLKVLLLNADLSMMVEIPLRLKVVI